jgi:uncharacterized protein YaeQ
MKYTCTITRHSSRGTLRGKTVLRAAPGEVSWHIALKILGYILFMPHAPRIEENVGWHFKPDLAAYAPDGGVSLWVDCGNIAVRKISRVAAWLPAAAEFHILRRTVRDASLLCASARAVRRPERVHITAFDNGFVHTLADMLYATNRMEAVLDNHRLALTVTCRSGTATLHSALHRLTPASGNPARPRS